MEAYFNQIKRLTGELELRQIVINKRVIAALTLSNLSEDYKPIIAIITQSLRANSAQINN